MGPGSWKVDGTTHDAVKGRYALVSFACGSRRYVGGPTYSNKFVFFLIIIIFYFLKLILIYYKGIYVFS